MNINESVVPETRYDRLELSTQILIREATLRGHRVEVLDENDNFIAIYGNGRTEYIKQATRTSADTYIAPLIMENKRVTKILLEQASISVPCGKSYENPDKALEDYDLWKDKTTVVKPNSTNFGTAVATLPRDFSCSEYQSAVQNAFAVDSQILVEEFITGEEYRILVIDDEVCAILKRIPANVTGDGDSSIALLVAQKNQDSRRGSGYTRPLEKIRLEQTEVEYLSAQGLTVDSVPAPGETVYLRKNSNISTGGDSVDMTDLISPGYKKIAVAAAAVAGAKICGVDMIIPDLSSEATADNYSIIELNFNPAIHIHAFPAEGKNRFPEKRVLDLLDL